MLLWVALGEDRTDCLSTAGGTRAGDVVGGLPGNPSCSDLLRGAGALVFMVSCSGVHEGAENRVPCASCAAARLATAPFSES